MSETEQQSPSARKSLLSAAALGIVLMLVVYAAPALQERLKEWSDREEAGEAAAGEKPPAPEVPGALAALLPQVIAQLPKNDDGSAKFRVRHMRTNAGGSELLIDLQALPEGEVFDLILRRDDFGRYISGDQSIPLKLYPEQNP